MFSDRYDVGASDFSNEEFPLVGGSQVNVIRSFARLVEVLREADCTDTGSDASLQFLCLRDTFPVDVTGMERSCDDDFSIDNLLVERRVFSLLVVGNDVGVSLGFEPFSDSELILNCTEQSGLFLGPFTTLVEDCKNFDLRITSVAISMWRRQGGRQGKHTILSYEVFSSELRLY